MLLANINLVVKDSSEWFPFQNFGSTGPTLDYIRECGFYPICVWKPYDHATEKLVPAKPHLIDGQVFTVDVAPMTDEDLAQRTATQWQVVRTQRNQMLKDTDWTQVADAPVDKAAWATYRQALRDITTQADPFKITWPKHPGQVDVLPIQ